MLQQICESIHNYFVMERHDGQFTAAEGVISLPFLVDGQRFLIAGSVLNDGMYTYQIYTIYETDKYYPYITTYFSSNEKFIEFAETTESKSIYRKGKVHFDANSKILTLSTCNNRFSDGRLAVHAIMIDAYTNPNS